jgi:hypothetical protein
MALASLVPGTTTRPKALASWVPGRTSRSKALASWTSGRTSRSMAWRAGRPAGKGVGHTGQLPRVTDHHLIAVRARRADPPTSACAATERRRIAAADVGQATGVSAARDRCREPAPVWSAAGRLSR